MRFLSTSRFWPSLYRARAINGEYDWLQASVLPWPPELLDTGNCLQFLLSDFVWRRTRQFIFLCWFQEGSHDRVLPPQVLSTIVSYSHVLYVASWEWREFPHTSWGAFPFPRIYSRPKGAMFGGIPTPFQRISPTSIPFPRIHSRVSKLWRRAVLAQPVFFSLKLKKYFLVWSIFVRLA